MSATSTDLKDVLNLSLGLLGEDSITSYDNPDTEAGIKMKRYMEFSIIEVQREYIWKELITEAELLSANSGDEYEYAIPSDCLRPIDVKYASLSALTIHPYFDETLSYYDMDGGVITTYASDPILIYLRSELDPTKWSSELEFCITLKLAINAGYLVTDNASLIQNLERKYESLSLPKAKLLQSKKRTNATKVLNTNFINLRSRKA